MAGPTKYRMELGFHICSVTIINYRISIRRYLWYLSRVTKITIPVFESKVDFNC